jgi:putative endonuclease
MKSYYTYVLQSDMDGRLYKGHTNDVEKRLKEHNNGKTKSTKGYIPWKLVYFELLKQNRKLFFVKSILKPEVEESF